MVITTKLSQRRYHECFVICHSLISTTPFLSPPSHLSLSLTHLLSLSLSLSLSSLPSPSSVRFSLMRRQCLSWLPVSCKLSTETINRTSNMHCSRDLHVHVHVHACTIGVFGEKRMAAYNIIVLLHVEHHRSFIQAMCQL